MASKIKSKKTKSLEVMQMQIELQNQNNLKSLFAEIRNYFAGNVTGISRDETIAQNIMRLLFCKIYTEIEPSNNNFDLDSVSAKNIDAEISKLFAKVKKKFPDLFYVDEIIEVKGTDLLWVVDKLWNLSLLSADRDVIGDAFEELIGTSFRGGEGQFFTPRNVVEMMVQILNPGNNSKIIDPACGSGGFLAHTSRHMIKSKIKNYEVVGIDKDAFLAKIARTYLSLLDRNNSAVFCENSLESPSNWKTDTSKSVNLESFDFVITNPPFGAKIPVSGKKLLSQFELGFRWELRGEKWVKTINLHEKQPPQIVFIERCVQLLKPGGKMGIVLPEGIFGNPSDRYIWEYLNKQGRIDGIVSLAQETFQPSTHTKTSVLFFTKFKSIKTSNDRLFMSIAEKVGHNKNGKLIYKSNAIGQPILNENGELIPDDDLPLVTERITLLLNGKASKKLDKYGYLLDTKEIHENIYIPEFYNPEIDDEIESLKKSGRFKIVKFGELMDSKQVKVTRGKEIGSNFYGTGNIPFVRTSDIVNWEIKADPIKGVSLEVYNQFAKLMDIQENDILFVNDGTFLIGRTAIITRLDLQILIQSHVRKIRVLNDQVINPFYLMYLLNLEVVQRQIKAKTFVQATISTIGNRLEEINFPIHLDPKEINRISTKVKEIITEKANLRERTANLYRD